jgi:WD40 repeat protein
VVGVSIALVTSLVLGGLALAQRQTALANEREAVEQRERAQEQTRVARSGELAQAAISQLAEDPELSLLLAIEAARIRRTVLVERSLREAVAASQVSLVYREHEADVNDLVFGPDGSWIASSSDDGTIRVWDPGTGATRFTIATGEHDTPLGRTFAVAADPSGRWLASAGERGGVRLWDPESGELLRTLEVRPYVYAMSTSSDGTVLATAGDAGVVAWDPNTAERIADIDVPGGAYGVGVSPDGRTLATAGGDRTIRLWSVASGAQIGRPFRGHQGLAWLAAFSPDGTKLVTAAEDRTARVWDVATREMEHVLPHVSLIQDAQFTRDGDYVVTADSEGVARIWSLATDEPVTELRGHETWITYLAVDPSHDRVATASVDGTVRVWRLGPGVATRTFDRGTMTWGASFGPEGATVAAAGTSDVVHVFDVGSGALLRTLTVPGSGRRELGAPVYSADGGTLAAPGIELPDATGFVQLWDASGSPTQRLDLDEFPLGISFSPDGERLVTNGIDASVRVWGLGSGEVTASYEGRRCPLQLPALAQVCTATFSPDGRTVLLTDGPAAVIWDPSTDEVIRRFRDDEGRGTQGHDLYSASFSPDGTMIATASEDSSVVVWDVAGGTQIARLEGHQGPVMSATFSPDGRSVVSASQDGTARVWSLDGEELARYRAAELMVNSAVFAADGRTILVSTAEGITNAPPGVPLKKVTTGGAKLFACEICVSYDDLLALARSRVTRQLTADERQRFLSTST